MADINSTLNTVIQINITDCLLWIGGQAATFGAFIFRLNNRVTILETRLEHTFNKFSDSIQIGRRKTDS